MKNRRISLVALALAGAFMVGCGDDDAPIDMGGTDAGPPVPVCPATAPPPDNQMGACCARVSNADRLDAPEMRLAGLRLTAPSGTLTGSIIRGILNKAFDNETFNWLIQASGAPMSGDGPVMIRTGYGVRDADGTYAFAIGSAPVAGGDAARWDPITVTGAMSGETLTTPPYQGAGPLTVPVFDEEDPTRVVVELPLFSLALTEATLTEGRTCLGTRGSSSYNTATGGRLRAFFRVEDARVRTVTVGTAVNAPLCAIIAGSLTDAAYCDQPQSAWTAKPNSLCNDTGCDSNTAGMMDVCDPSGGMNGCNAWEVLGEFAAQGVEVTN
jgi:hypothetical protein